MSVEAIKKALEGVTPDRLRYEADAMFAAVQGEQYGDTFHAYNWGDKPHRVLYDAVGLMRDAATTLESLQSENEGLLAENGELRNIVSNCAAALLTGAFVSPKCSVDFMKDVPKEIASTVGALRALASTGGGHNAE